MTDEEIRSYMRWHYRGDQNGPMAETIFKIASYVRDRVTTWTESDVTLLLRERLAMSQRGEMAARGALEREKNTDWRKYYLRLYKIHVEDVRKRKEVRRFRLVNFSVDELKAELQRRNNKGE